MEARAVGDLDVVVAEREDLSRVAEIWANVRGVFHDMGQSIGRAFTAFGRGIAIAAKAVWQALCWFCREVLLRIGYTGANILGYLFDKILYGSPGLRRHFKDGLIDSEIPERWRTFVRENTGWDIYETMHPAVDNILGAVLGGGIGVLTMVNHLFTSMARMIRNGWHLLGRHGVFGDRTVNHDQRKLGVKIAFTILAAPLYLPVIAVTNLFDLVLTGIKHFAINFGLSFVRNVKATYNLMGSDGIMGERQPLQDDRCLPIKIFFGIVSAPFVFIPVFFTNLLDVACAFMKNMAISLAKNVAGGYHLLGSYGVFGERTPVTDNRGLPAKIIFGILSAPLVLIPCAITNFIDGFCKVVQQTAISFSNNLSAVFNLLGRHGLMGDRQPFDDERTSMAAKVIYGIISAPFVAAVAVVTNFMDMFGMFAMHMGLSVAHNTKVTFNLMGDKGVMGPRQAYTDERPLAIRIIFGILSAPIVAAVSLVTNALDAFCVFAKHFGLSYARNIRTSFNCLGDEGMMGARRPYQDNRRLSTKIVYGIISFPFVLASAVITNTIDILLSLSKHAVRSFARNLRATYHLLGRHGVMGERTPLQDDRKLNTKIIYGIISAPLVFIPAAITNLIDGVCTFIKHTMLSFGRNLRVTFNLLGRHGYLGERKEFQDNRHLAVKIIFGIVSAPLVAAFALVTNAFDASLIILKQIGLSFKANLRVSFNLLGEHGIFGSRKTFNDDRPMALKVVFGILSAPLVLVPALITNAFDMTITFLKHLLMSFVRNLNVVFNLFGERRHFHDDRHMAVKIIFGILSAPLVFVPAFISNALRALILGIKYAAKGLAIFIRETALSVGHNVKANFNLLGRHGVMGDRHPYNDTRSMAKRVVYGIITFPVVLVSTVITNLIDITSTFIKNMALSIGHNLRCTFNLLGKHGVMGPRRDYRDQRPLAARIAFGILSAPIVGVAMITTNVIDAVCAYFKNYKNTILKPLFMVTGGVLLLGLAVPIYLLRKTIKGLYNAFIRPFVEMGQHKPVTGILNVLKGLANLATVGLFSVCKRIFKAATGYTNRFGFQGKLNRAHEQEPNNEYVNTLLHFRDAIHASKRGGLDGVRDVQGKFRVLVRGFYGFRHKSEQILKAMHDAYKAYVSQLVATENTDQTSVAYSMNSFFGSQQYQAAKQGIRLRDGEEGMIEAVESRFQPVPV